MKGVIRRIAPAAGVIDLTHAVAPQDVVQGAFLLQQAWRYFPSGTVHLVVVDPGVGTSRRRLALQYEGHYFVGPDNGVLSAALPDAARGQRGAGEAYVASEIDVPEGVRAFAGDGGAAVGVSATFEGRDVFAPAAAFLANGGDIARIGRPVERMLALPAFRAPGLQGVVLHVDRYGNLVTDIRGDDVPAGAGFEVAGRRVGARADVRRCERDLRGCGQRWVCGGCGAWRERGGGAWVGQGSVGDGRSVDILTPNPSPACRRRELIATGDVARIGRLVSSPCESCLLGFACLCLAFA